MVTRPINRSAQRSPPDAQPSPAAQPTPDLSPGTAQDRIRPPRAKPDLTSPSSTSPPPADPGWRTMPPGSRTPPPPPAPPPPSTHLPHHHPLLSQQLPHQPLHHLPRPPLLVLDPFPEVPGVPDELPEPRPAPIADREQPPPVGLVGGRLHPRPRHLLPRCPQPPPLLAPTSVGRRGEPGHLSPHPLTTQRRLLPLYVRYRARHRELPAVEVPALAGQLPDHDQVLLQLFPDHAQHQLPNGGLVGPGPEVLGYAQELPEPGPVVPAAGEHGAAVLRPAQQVDLDLAHGLWEVNLAQHVPWDARDVDVDGGAAVGLRYRPQADPAPAGQVEAVSLSRVCGWRVRCSSPGEPVEQRLRRRQTTGQPTDASAPSRRPDRLAARHQDISGVLRRCLTRLGRPRAAGEDHADPIPELGDGVDQDPHPARIGAEPLLEGRKPDGHVDRHPPAPLLHRDRLPTRRPRPRAPAVLAHPTPAHRRRHRPPRRGPVHRGPRPYPRGRPRHPARHPRPH